MIIFYSEETTIFKKALAFLSLVNTAKQEEDGNSTSGDESETEKITSDYDN